MVETTFTDNEFQALLGKLFESDSKQAENSREDIFDLLSAKTNKRFAGTAWGAYNAVVEWYDHHKRQVQSNLERDNIAFERAMFDKGGFKQKALEEIMQISELEWPKMKG